MISKKQKDRIKAQAKQQIKAWHKRPAPAQSPIVTALEKKVRGEGRMPSVKALYDYLKELPHLDVRLQSTSYTPSRCLPSGVRYWDGKTVNGWVLEVRYKKGNKHVATLDTTSGYYSSNTHIYAINILDAINPKK